MNHGEALLLTSEPPYDFEATLSFNESNTDVNLLTVSALLYMSAAPRLGLVVVRSTAVAAEDEQTLVAQVLQGLSAEGLELASVEEALQKLKLPHPRICRGRQDCLIEYLQALSLDAFLAVSVSALSGDQALALEWIPLRGTPVTFAPLFFKRAKGQPVLSSLLKQVADSVPAGSDVPRAQPGEAPPATTPKLASRDLETAATVTEEMPASKPFPKVAVGVALASVAVATVCSVAAGVTYSNLRSGQRIDGVTLSPYSYTQAQALNTQGVLLIACAALGGLGAASFGTVALLQW